MPACEICGQNQLRRYRLKNGKLVCWTCKTHYHWKPEAFLPWIKRLRDDVAHWKKTANDRVLRTPSERKYRFTSPYSAIPPKDILKNAIYALDRQNQYTDFPKVLADYYEIDTPPFYDNPDKVPDGALACYYPWYNQIYSRGSISRKNAFHEIYHALENFGIVPKTSESEKNADEYAYGCLERLKSD